jgi:large subunit ribosomal protein L32e
MGKQPKKFIRRNWTKASRLGKGRKKKQVWRAPKGRHSKTRKKRKGYPTKVMIGFKQEKKGRNIIKDHKPIIVKNLRELENIKKGEIAIIGKIGNKKRIEMVKMAKEKGIPIHNLNVKKFLKKVKMEEKTEKTKEEKQEKKK